MKVKSIAGDTTIDRVALMSTEGKGLSAARLGSIIQDWRLLATELRQHQEKAKTENPALSYRFMGQAEMLELLSFQIDGEKQPFFIAASDFGFSLSSVVIPALKMMIAAGEAVAPHINAYFTADRDRIEKDE